jgi:hypothetical protein
MAHLSLNLVFGSHPGRFRPIFDGTVKPEGITLKTARVQTDELFWRIPTKGRHRCGQLSLTGASEAISRMLELCWKDGYIDRGRPFTVDEYFDGSTLQL